MQRGYRTDFGLENVDELKKNITSTHDDFLREDDPEKKAEALRYMCAYVTQFLYVVPHDKKFIFKETGKVLHQSAMNISDFDPREASIAFEYLGKYAQNILDQPWRNDFHTIKLTSGFYVHNISSQLKNAHEILVAVGYVHTDETTLQVVANMDERKVKDVSRDMIVASQECVILSQIWQRVSDQEPDYPLTTGEVFDYRRKYVGDTDTLCKTMLTDIRRRDHEHEMQRIVKATTGRNFVPVDKLIDYCDEMEVDGKGSGRNADEVELVENVLHHTILKNESGTVSGPNSATKEHIYDAVFVDNSKYSGRTRGLVNNPEGSVCTMYPHHGTSAFVPLNRARHSVPHSSSHQLSTRESVTSPLIPETVAYVAARTRARLSDQNYVVSSNSVYNPGVATALQLTKVSQEELEDWERNPLPNRRKMENNDIRTTIPWSQWERGVNPIPVSSLELGRQYSERPQSYAQESSRSRRPIMPTDVYPDDCFPRVVVKPTPCQASSSRPRYNTNDSSNMCDLLQSGAQDGSDLINEALAYRSEVNGQLDSLENVFYNQLLHKQRVSADDRRESIQEDLSPTDANLNIITKSAVENKQITNVLESPKIRPWSCRFCTFKNKKEERICEVCCKSKDFFEEEDDSDEIPAATSPVDAIPKLYSQTKSNGPKPVGSSDPNAISCPYCTLLNSPSRVMCEACENRLRNANSPKTFV